MAQDYKKKRWGGNLGLGMAQRLPLLNGPSVSGQEPTCAEAGEIIQ